jgi:serine protease Do
MKKKLLVFLALLVSITLVSCDSFYYVSSEFKCTSIDTVDVVENITNDYTKVYDMVSPSVGMVYIFNTNQQYSILSGTIFKKTSDGYYMVTSLIEPTTVSEYEIILGDLVRFNNDQISYVGSHAPFHMSILKIKTDMELVVPKIGSSGSLAIGEDVLAIGTPNASNIFNTMTKGIVSGVNETYYPQYNPPYIVDSTVNIVGFQFDAPTNYGQRGGGVFNTKGELVGIIAERYYATASGSSTITVDSMSFAMGMDELETPFNSIIETGSYTKPKIGITVLDLYAMSDAQKQALNEEEDPTDPLPAPIPLNIHTGLFIRNISPNSAGSEANLVAGHIITHVEGEPIRKMSTLDRKLMHYVAGQKLTITVLNPTTNTPANYTLTLK